MTTQTEPEWIEEPMRLAERWVNRNRHDRRRNREHEVSERERFEAEISGCPYEKDISRFGEESAWPGNYKDLSVDLAWCMWQAARALPPEPPPAAPGQAEGRGTDEQGG